MLQLFLSKEESSDKETMMLTIDEFALYLRTNLTQPKLGFKKMPYCSADWFLFISKDHVTLDSNDLSNS
jgi:hypothetical protein